jgi:hypothetical protein
MAFIPGWSGYLAIGSRNLHEQVIITDDDEMTMNTYWVSYGPLPGIY